MATSIAERINASETHLFKAVFPGAIPPADPLFSGAALKLMDEVAFITATRFSRKKMATVAADRITFVHPVPAGTILELIGKVTEVGNTSLKVQVDVVIEEMYGSNREKTSSGTFTFVAVDEAQKTLRILK